MGLITVPNSPHIFKPIGLPTIDWDDPLARGLVGYWGMFPYEAGGNKVFDLSGNSNIGTFQGGVSWGSGKFGPAPLIDGVNGSYIQVPDSSVFDDKRTISLWFRRVGGYSLGAGNERLFEHRDTDATAAGLLITLNDATGSIRVINDAGASNTLVLDTTITSWADRWYHFALIADGVNGIIYIDGIYDNSGAFTTAFTNSINTLHLGADRGGNQALAGLLDIPLVYNRILTVSEIAQLYREPFRFIISPRERALFVKKPTVAPPAGIVVLRRRRECA